MNDDRGFVTVWTVAISAVMFLIIGFTLDAGRIVRANSDAYGTAAAAARIAVNQLDMNETIEQGHPVLDQAEGRRLALVYITERGYEGTVEFNAGPLQAQVEVTGTVDPHMPAVDDQDIEVHATAQAIPVPG